jgi:hypothetical protein
MGRERRVDLTDVVRVVVGHLVHLLPQRTLTHGAVNERQITPSLVMLPRQVNHGVPDRPEHLARQLEREMGIVESAGPGVLIEHQERQAGLAESPPYPLVQDRLAVGQMME